MYIDGVLDQEPAGGSGDSRSADAGPDQPGLGTQGVTQRAAQAALGLARLVAEPGRAGLLAAELLGNGPFYRLQLAFSKVSL